MRAGRCEQRVSGQRGLSGRRRCNDTLISGQANDTLYGGVGSDRFEFQASMGDDTIGDFDELNDEIRLDGFTGIGNGLGRRNCPNSIGFRCAGDSDLAIIGIAALECWPDVQGAMSVSGTSSVIDYGGNTITIENTVSGGATILIQDDFVFA
ncbi:hypothetical protein JYP51_08390 [Ponticoccus gilvus]|nr:hypothetical protein [Enemella evansiae]